MKQVRWWAAALLAALVGGGVAGATPAGPMPGAGLRGAPAVAGTRAAAGTATVGGAAALRGAGAGDDGAGDAANGAAASKRTERWQWPVGPEHRITRGFDPPDQAWGSGHRGIDLAANAGAAVVAVADGVVSHVGVIAGKPTISVLHGDGVRSTYEPVSPTVKRGQRVRAGQVIGQIAQGPVHGTSPTLHLGALREQTYLNPLLFINGGRVRLLPLNP